MLDKKKRNISTRHLRTDIVETGHETFKCTKCMTIHLEITVRNFTSLSGITLVHHRINIRHQDNATMQKVKVSFDNHENEELAVRACARLFFFV